MLKSKTRLILTIVLLIMVTFNNAKAQTRISSPYSMFGLGELQDYNNPRYAGMGGLGLSLRNPYSVNVLNPASYTAFDSLSFVFEGGVVSNYTTLSNNLLSQKSNYTSLSYITFGFPVTRWWKASFGLLPFSSVGYKISDNQYVDKIGNVIYRYEGSGGINQFYLGNAFKLNKDFSIGVNASYMFGSVNKIKSAIFPDSNYVFNSKINKTTNIGNMYFTFGVQYNKSISKNYTLFAGAIFSSSTKATTNEDFTANTYSLTSTENEIAHDTVVNYSENGTVQIPMKYGFGFAIERNNKWLIGVDYTTQNWSDYSYNGIVDSLKNSSKLSIGLEIKPVDNARYYYQRVAYRFGFKYATNFLEIDNNKLTEYCISFGLGLPLRKTRSTVNVAIEIGKKGATSSTDSRLLLENYTRFTIGFSAHDIWFFKRKFD